MVKRFVEEVQLRPVDTRTGGAQAQQAFANQLQALKSDTEELQAAIGTRQGVREAQAVEQQRDEQGNLIAPETRDIGIIDTLATGGARTAAFNKTVRDGYLASLENDIRLDVNQLRIENPDNLTAFNDAVSGMRKGVLQGTDQAVRPAVQKFLDQQITTARLRVQEDTLAKAESEAKAEIQAALDSASTDAFRAAREGDRRGAANALLDAFAQIDNQLESGTIDQAKAQEKRLEVEREATEQGFLFQLEAVADTQGIPAAFRQLDKASKELPKGFTPDQADALISRGQTFLARKKSRSDAINATALKQAREELGDFEKSLALGIPVDPMEVNRVKRLTGLDPSGTLQKRFAIAQDTASFSLLSRTEREAVLQAGQTGKLEDVDRMAAMMNANKQVNDAYRENGYAMGVKQGLIEEVPFNIDDPEGFQRRVEQAQTLSQHAGVPVSALDDSSAQLVSNALPAMTVPEKVALATTLSADPEAWGQLDKKNANAFAMAGATSDNAVMTAVFTGQELVAQKLVRKPKPKDTLEVFQEETEGVYGAEDAGSLLQAATNHYLATSGVIDGELDEKEFKKSIQAVSGGIDKVNGLKIELPRGVSADDFENFIQTLEPETIDELGGVANMDSERAMGLIRGAKLTTRKNGNYTVNLDNGSLFSAQNPAMPFFIKWDQDLVDRNAALHALRASTRRRAARAGPGGQGRLERRREREREELERRPEVVRETFKRLEPRLIDIGP